ncbi:MAG: DUF5615 family PIN-like protein [Pyrinomonadaceae bacterium]
MIKILADQNFNGRILRGVRARISTLDVVRTQDLGFHGWTDDQLLDWAAENNRVIVTHDEKTFHIFAYERMTKSKKMSGVIVVPDQTPIGKAIEDLVTVITCNFDNEWENNITRIPI